MRAASLPRSAAHGGDAAQEASPSDAEAKTEKAIAALKLDHICRIDGSDNVPTSLLRQRLANAAQRRVDCHLSKGACYTNIRCHAVP